MEKIGEVLFIAVYILMVAGCFGAWKLLDSPWGLLTVIPVVGGAIWMIQTDRI